MNEEIIPITGYFENIEKNNIKFLRKTNPEDFATLLLTGFKKDSLYPLSFFESPSLTLQLGDLYKKTDNNTKEILSSGTAIAIDKWKKKNDGFYVLTELRYFSMFIKEDIKPTNSIINIVNENRDNINSNEAVLGIINSLRGFKKREEIGNAFVKWWEGKMIKVEPKGILFLGLIEYHPENWDKYLKDLTGKKEKIPNYFNEVWWYCFSEAVNIEDFKQNLESLSPKLLVSFKKFLMEKGTMKKLNNRKELYLGEIEKISKNK